MSSATPIASSVREVLLNTSAPYGRRFCTATRASWPDATTAVVMPLRARDTAARSILSSVASAANSNWASSSGGAKGCDAVVSLTVELRQTAMHERDRHRAFADCGRASLDRAAADVAGGKQTGEVRL